MEQELEHWKGVALNMTRDVRGKDMVIGALVFIITLMAMTLFFANWGWHSAKVECARARENTYKTAKICSNKNLKSV